MVRYILVQSEALMSARQHLQLALRGLPRQRADGAPPTHTYIIDASVADGAVQTTDLDRSQLTRVPYVGSPTARAYVQARYRGVRRIARGFPRFETVLMARKRTM